MSAVTPEGLRAELKYRFDLMNKYLDVCPNNLTSEQLSQISRSLLSMAVLVNTYKDISVSLSDKKDIWVIQV